MCQHYYSQGRLVRLRQFAQKLKRSQLISNLFTLYFIFPRRRTILVSADKVHTANGKATPLYIQAKLAGRHQASNIARENIINFYMLQRQTFNPSNQVTYLSLYTPKLRLIIASVFISHSIVYIAPKLNSIQTRTTSFFYMSPLDIYEINTLIDRLPKPTVNGSIGTNYSLLTQPLVLLNNVGTITEYVTQPLINTKKPTTSVIRVLLRYRSIKAISALKSPILQVIRRFLKPVATNMHFFGKPSFLLKLSNT